MTKQQIAKNKIAKANDVLEDADSGDIKMSIYEAVVEALEAAEEALDVVLETSITEDTTSYFRALVRYMSELSEEHYSAGWCTGCEVTFWACVVGDRIGDRQLLESHEIADLKMLSRKAGGWARWSQEDGDPVFVPIEEWERVYAEVKT